MKNDPQSVLHDTRVIFVGAMHPKAAIPFPKATELEVKLWQLKQAEAMKRKDKK